MVKFRLGGAGGKVTYYSSSNSRGKLHVVSSSRRHIGRPNNIDMDLSAIGPSRAQVSDSDGIGFWKH